MNNLKQIHKLIIGYDIDLFTNFEPYCCIDENIITETSYTFDTTKLRYILNELYGREFIINKIKEKLQEHDLKDSRTIYIELQYPSEEELFYLSLIDKEFLHILEEYKVSKWKLEL